MTDRPPFLASISTRRSLRRCIPVALLVGVVLSLVNQGSVVASGDATTATWARVVANFVVPFCVSSYGFWSAGTTR